MEKLPPIQNNDKKPDGRKLTNSEITQVVVFSILGLTLGYFCYSRNQLYEFRFKDFFSDTPCLLFLLGSIGCLGYALYKGYPAMKPKE